MSDAPRYYETVAMIVAERDALREAVVNWSIEAAELKREVERLTARLPHPNDLRMALRVIERAESTGDVDAWDYQVVKDVLRAALADEKGEG